MPQQTRAAIAIAMAVRLTAALLFLAAGTAGGQLKCEIGLLDLAANGGINPATGSPWQAGDQYRFVFVSSATRDATSTNIADYNAFVQDLANAATLNLVRVYNAGPTSLLSFYALSEPLKVQRSRIENGMLLYVR